MMFLCSDVLYNRAKGYEKTRRIYGFVENDYKSESDVGLHI